MKKKFLLFFLFIALCFAGLTAQKKAVGLQHVAWRTWFEPSKTSLSEGWLVFEARVDSGWQFFAQNQLPQLPVGIEIMIHQARTFEVTGKLIAPPPQISFSHTFNKPVAVYKGKVQFRQKIILKSLKEFSVKAEVENEECDYTEEIFYYSAKVDVNVKPPKGVKLKFL